MRGDRGGVHLNYASSEYGLCYLRDKEKREVDFLVTKNKSPWLLVEAKLSNNSGISKSLYYYAEQLNVSHAFQVVGEDEFVNVNCFNAKKPIIVSAKTFLSQLL